jgi:hypothetical protein
MKMSDKNLGFGDGEYGDVGQVDLFGLDEFGQNPGKDAIWGAAIGAGLGTGTAIALRAFTKNSTLHKYSEGIGFLVGGGVSGAMAAMEKTRYAGWVGLMTAFLSNGLRQAETLLFPSDGAAQIAVLQKQIAAMIAAGAKLPVDGWGVALPEFAAPVVEMGAPVIEMGGYLGATPPVNLMGNGGLGAGAADVQIQGGPAISGLASHFGATLFG